MAKPPGPWQSIKSQEADMASLQKFKLISLFILFFFSFQSLGFPILAQGATAITAAAPTDNPLIALGTKTQALSTALRSIQEGLKRSEDQIAQLSTAQTQFREILALEGPVEAKLAEIEATLQNANAPQPFLDRHNAFVVKTKEGFTQLKGIAANLNALIVRGNVLSAEVEPIAGALEILGPPPAPDPLGSNAKLSHRRSDLKPRAIEERPAITPGTTLPGPQDLAATKDVRITQEIQDLAAQLQNNPVEIFKYVRNKIDYQPYFGSVKGSLGVYWEKAGNDMDQASLLIALFRVADVPARYISGIVDLNLEKLMNWTGVKNAQAAVNLLSQNGIPFEARASADGTITHFRLFQTWVAAFLPGKGWVQMNPSFKQYEYVEGIDIPQAIGFKSDAFYSAATDGATIDPVQSYVKNMNEANIESSLSNYADNLMAWVNANMPGATVGDVLGYRNILPKDLENLNNLKQSFPFKTYSPQLEFSVLPDYWKYAANFQMYGFSYDISLPEIYGKRLNIAYVPATAFDQYLIDFYGGIFNVPAYLVDMKPQLKLEGQLVADGLGVILGTYQVCRSSFLMPLGVAWDTNDKYVRTGADYSVSLDHQQISPDIFKNRIEKYKNLIATLGGAVSQEVVEEALHVTGLAYFAQSDMFSNLSAIISKVSWTREPSQAFLVRDLSVRSIWGIPIQVLRGSLGIDVKRNVVSPVSSFANTQNERTWMLASGSMGSAAEHGVFEQIFLMESVSTEKILTLANRQGIPIYQIDRNNINMILPLLSLSESVKQSISNMVINYGWTAVVPQRNIQLNRWYGAGWVVLDPDTGGAGYMISGGLMSYVNTNTSGGNGTETFLDSLFSDIGETLEKVEMSIETIAAIIAALTTAGIRIYTIVAIGGSITLVTAFGTVALGVAAGIVTYYLIKALIAYWVSLKINRRRWFALSQKHILTT